MTHLQHIFLKIQSFSQEGGKKTQKALSWKSKRHLKNVAGKSLHHTRNRISVQYVHIWLCSGRYIKASWLRHFMVTDESLLTVLKISQHLSFSVFLKFGETFLFGFCRSNWNGFENWMNFKKNEDLPGCQSSKDLTLWSSVSLAEWEQKGLQKHTLHWRIK